MALRFVQHPVKRPQTCAIIPFIGATNELRGFFTAGTNLAGEEVYVSWTAFLQMADYANFVPAAGRVSDEVASLRGQLEEAQATIAEQERLLDAVDTLKRGGFESKRRPGRPKGAAKVEREPEAVAA